MKDIKIATAKIETVTKFARHYAEALALRDTFATDFKNIDTDHDIVQAFFSVLIAAGYDPHHETQWDTAFALGWEVLVTKYHKTYAAKEA